MKNILFSLFVFTLLISCDNQVVQYPVAYSNDDFIQRSQERGKLLLKEETEWFETYKENSKLTFNKTESGFWISNEGIKKETTAKLGDYVQYTFQVSDLDDNIIYSFQEIGNQKAILGKTDIIRGLHAALQIIEKGNEAKILLPSFLAYGGLGDNEKITPNQPIIIDLKIIDIKKN